MNVYDRLMQLSRSPEQDDIIRRLLDGGLQVTALDVVRPKKRFVGEDFKGEYISLRDKSFRRYVVDRQGRMSVSGRTEWEVIS